VVYPINQIWRICEILVYDVSVYDPFFKNELLDKYLYENNLEKADFRVLTDLDDSALDNISCICVVQHHIQTQIRLDEIYKKSLVPVLYDCQSKTKKDPKSKTILKSLGS